MTIYKNKYNILYCKFKTMKLIVYLNTIGQIDD